MIQQEKQFFMDCNREEMERQAKRMEARKIAQENLQTGLNRKIAHHNYTVRDKLQEDDIMNAKQDNIRRWIR